MATPRIDYSPWEKTPEESLYDYYTRLNKNREGGILGTGGLLDLPKAATEEDTKLGVASANPCPAGYTLVNGACVKADPEGEGEPVGWDRWKETLQGKVAIEGHGEEKAKKIFDTQAAVDRLTGRAPVLDDALALLIPGAGIAALAKKAAEGEASDEELEALREYMGSGADTAMVAESLKAGGMADSEIERVMSDQETLSRMHATGMTDVPAKDDWAADQGIVGKAFSGIKGALAGLFAPTPESYDEAQSRKFDAMTAGQRGSMFGGAEWNAANNSLMTGNITAVPSFLATTGANWDAGMFSQGYAEQLKQQEEAVQASVAAVEEQKRIEEQKRVEAAKAAEARMAAMRASEAARQAENRRVNDIAYGSGSSVYGGGSGSSASSASRRSSALGSGSSVGSRGGNASRGFSSGGW